MRPKLAATVRARRHQRPERTIVVLHQGERRFEIGEREWALLRHADGSRDVEGLVRAAADEGTTIALSHARAFLDELAQLGLLDERPSQVVAEAFAPDRPVLALDRRFRCDGAGACCRMFDSYVFTPLDRARARAACPEVGGCGQRPRPFFMPESGSVGALAVPTLVDGCAFADGRGCAIHAVAGADAKPFGCRTFPIHYVDVGDAIRVAVRPECSCAFVDRGEPLTIADHGRDLPRELYVAKVDGIERLDAIPVPSDVDLADWTWALADAIGGGIAVHGDRRAPPIRLDATRASVERLRAANAFRAGTAVARALEFVREALDRLGDQRPDRDDEQFYLRTLWFVGTPLTHERGLEADLRERSMILRLARAFSAEARATAIARHPLACLEVLIRGHGLVIG